MAIPPAPDYPDDDPVESLRMLRNYLREMWEYFAPLEVGAALFTAAIVGSILMYYVVNIEPILSWSAESVPMVFALVGIVVSVKKLNEKHHFSVISLLVIVGIAGTVLLHLARAHSEAAHAAELSELRTRMDTVRDQNGQLLKAFVGRPPLTSQQAEVERRRNIQESLRGEYILSHENVTAGLLAGTELPPAEWMNKRLHELGERWTVSSRPALATTQAPSPKIEDGKVFINLALGDDNAASARSYASDDPHMKCGPPFVCYAQDQPITGPILLDFTGKKQKRVFFSIANTGNVVIQHYMVTGALSRADGQPPHGISIYRAGEGHGSETANGVEWHQNEVQDLVPISKSKGFTDFTIDIVANEDCDLDFSLGLKIFGPNLPSQQLVVQFRIVRSS